MSASSDIIQARSAERKESRAEHNIPFCWEQIKRPHTTALPPSSALSLEGAKLPPTWAGIEADDVLFALLAPKAPACLLQAIDDALGRGARVYVLAAPEMDVLGQRSRAPQGRLLIRRARELPASGLLTRRGQRAGICLGAPSEAPSFWLPLSPHQGESLFASCLHLFWEHASDEACLGDGSLRFTPPLKAPFPSPLPAGGAIELSRTPFALCGDSADLLYLPGGELPPSAPKLRTLLTPASGKRQPELAELARSGVRVVWHELHLPALSLGAADGGVLLGDKGWHLRIRLVPEQVAGLRQHIEAAVRAAEYVLRIETRLRNLRGAVWLPDAGAPELPPEQVSLDAGTVAAERLGEVRTLEPTVWPAPPELAREVCYRFVVQPPRAPSGARPDPLVKEWKDLDDRFGERCRLLDKQLDAVEEHEGLLYKAFAMLSGVLLGHGRKRERLREKLRALERSLPSAADPQGAMKQIEALAEIEQQAEVLTDELREEDRSAHERKDREEQEEKFRQTQKELRSSLDRAEQEAARFRKELDAVLKQQSEPAPEKEPEGDRKVRLQKIEDERRRIETKLTTAEAQCAQDEEALKEAFVFRPSGQSTLRTTKGKGALFVPTQRTQKAQERVPGEALPRVGSLLQHKKQRFLAIQSWSELEQGQQEAGRLNAQLVAPMEAQ